MKKQFTLISILTLLLFGSSSFAFAQDLRSFDFNHESNGFQIVEQSKGNISINFSIDKLDLIPVEYKGEVMHEVGVNGIVLPNQKGMPNVPSFSRMIAVPQGAEAVINVVSYEKESIKDVNIAPSRGIEPQVVEPTVDYIKDDKIYSENTFYPSTFAGLGDHTTLRGIDIVTLNINPVQFNPVTKEAIVYHNIEISVEYKGGNGQFGDNAYRSQYFDPILAQNILNYNDLPKIDYEARLQQWIKDGSDGYEYIIVTPNNDAWAPYAQQLADLRAKQGISTKVFRLDEMGVSTTMEMRAWFHNAYNEWTIKPVAVCLFGDHNNDMTQGIPAETISHSYSGQCITDNRYADPNNDLLPDMTFSRLIAQNESELPIFVGKQIEYEIESPNMDADSYKYPVTALGWQTERWFQLCSEVAGGYFRTLDKEPVRINQIYEGTPGSIWSSADNTDLVVDYFGPDGLGYLPASPNEMGDWNSGSPEQIVEAINAGTFIVQHRDHGLETGWGEPAFRNSHVDQLTNVGKLPFVMSINCLTGKYNLTSGDCFAERFMRHTYNGENAGAVAMLCPTEVSFSFVNDAYVWGVYDQFDPNFMPDYGPYAEYEGNWFPAFGNVAGKYFLYQCSWPYNDYDKDITYQMFTAHCDAFLRIYTEVPQEMAVTHQSVQLAGNNVFTISAPENTTIALSVYNSTEEQYEILAVAEATGSNQNITIPAQVPPTVINVVVTGHNYLRYEAEVEVIPAEGPYLILDAYELNSDNDQLDFGETTSFNLTFKNVGNETSPNATATLASESEYITVTNSTVTFDELSPDGTIDLGDAFEITVSDSVPNSTLNTLTVNIESGEDSYQSYINIRAYAPVLKIENVSIEETMGNGNGYLDPAEEAILTFTIVNDGGSNTNEIVSELLMHNSFIEVLSDPVTTESLEADGSTTVSFDIYVTPGTPIGFAATYSLTSTSGYYSATKDFSTKIGLIIEDFESGDFSGFEWDNNSPTPWTICDTDPYEGNYCIKSGAISDNQSTEITLTYEVSGNDSISFYHKVSSENGWDKLKFYIDNQELGTWSGSSNWTFARYAVSEGTHTFRWVYQKDGSVSSGEDCAWIDFISFPPDRSMAITAGTDIDACPDSEVELNGFASNYSSLEWTTDGDGSFSDINIVNPIYTPGDQDIENGEVVLTLTGTDADDETISDDVVVTFLGDPSLVMDENASICFNETYAAEPEVLDFFTVTWTTSGDGTFDDADDEDAVYTPGTQDIENGEVTLTISVEGCSIIEQSIVLTIIGAPSIDVPQEASACGNEGAVLSATTENVTNILWTTAGDGTFADATAEETVYTPGTQDIANGGTTLTITAEGCSTISEEVNLTIREALTLLNYSTEYNVCPNNEAELLIEFSGLAPFTVMFEGDDTEYQILEDNILRLNIENESASYTMTEVIDANGCYASLNNTFTVNVIALPVLEKPAGETIIAKDENPSTSYSVTANEAYSTYEWLLEPAEAGTVEGDSNVINIVWNQSYNGDASLKVRGENDECETEYSEALNIFSSMISVDEINAQTLNVYPNPVDETLNIELSSINSNKVNIFIYNILGECVYSQEVAVHDNVLNTQINVENLAKGSYFLKAITNDNVWKQQIIVK